MKKTNKLVYTCICGKCDKKKIEKIDIELILNCLNDEFVDVKTAKKKIDEIIKSLLEKEKQELLEKCIKEVETLYVNNLNKLNGIDLEVVINILRRNKL